MRLSMQRILPFTLAFALIAAGFTAAGQTQQLMPPTEPLKLAHPAPLAPSAVPPQPPPTAYSDPPISVAASQPLLDFKSSDIKFELAVLMKLLRDSRHEGWVLAAYPDPTTSRPLVGAGFSLEVAATEHIQGDPLNPNPFIEPSSAQLWQAAGLDPERLHKIIEQFDANLQTWKLKRYRKKSKTHRLSPMLSEADATKLLRVSAIQAIHNAKAYCRDFDQLTAAQQIALSQMVFQMGVNLEEFVQFLGALNDGLDDTTLPDGSTENAREHWRVVQQTLIDSQWAKRYTTRAVAVIAMWDLDYAADPKGAERRVRSALPLPVSNHHRGPQARTLRAGNGRGTGRMPHQKRRSSIANRS